MALLLHCSIFPWGSVVVRNMYYTLVPDICVIQVKSQPVTQSQLIQRRVPAEGIWPGQVSSCPSPVLVGHLSSTKKAVTDSLCPLLILVVAKVDNGTTCSEQKKNMMLDLFVKTNITSR